MPHYVQKPRSNYGFPGSFSARFGRSNTRYRIVCYLFVCNEAACRKAFKICNDLRLLSSGPRAGLFEINLPPMQPGSSIMPGKVNPVIPEVVNQVCFKVFGNDLTVTFAAEAGQLQLNVMEPVLSHAIMENIHFLCNALDTLREKCVVGITANREVCLNMVKHSIGIVTALNPYIGYKHSTEIAKEALETGKVFIISYWRKVFFPRKSWMKSLIRETC